MLNIDGNKDRFLSNSIKILSAKNETRDVFKPNYDETAW